MPPVASKRNARSRRTAPAFVLAALAVAACWRYPRDGRHLPPEWCPVGDRAVHLAWLRKRDFPRLEKLFEELEVRHVKEPRAEVALVEAYRTFRTDDPEIGALLDDWMRRSPERLEPLLAKAQFLATAGWRARGGGWARDTTAEQFRRMDAFHAEASRLLEKVLDRDPSSFEAQVQRIDLDPAHGGAELCREHFELALRKWPASFRLREEYSTCSEPRWGGSLAEERRWIRQARRYVDADPRFAAFGGWLDSQRAQELLDDKKPKEALAAIESALAYGDYFEFFAVRARIQRELGHLEGAIADFGRALELRPEETPVLADRADAWLELGKVDLARDDVELIERIDPGEPNLGWIRGRLDSAAYEAASAAWAAGQRALARTDEAQEIDELRQQVALDPGNFDLCLRLDRLLTPRAEWDTIIDLWTTYLATDPQNPRALIERSGAYWNSRQFDVAISDLDLACQLGETKACEDLVKSRRALAASR